MHLHADDIAIWIARLDEADDSALAARWRALLDGSERARELRYRLADDRRRHLLARALARTALARHTGIAPQRLRFVRGRHGKPELAGDNPGDHRFNLSHAAGVVALAVARGRALGIDTESLRARALSLGAVERNFAADEIAELRALPAAARARRTIEHWTLKEAYAKARGIGLTLPLDRFGVRVDDARLRLWMAPGFDDAPERWRLWQFLDGEDQLLALCAQHRPDAAPARIRAIACSPLRYETPIALRLLRASGEDALPLSEASGENDGRPLLASY
ncbi:4'-phosphopantetheinyl transferase family protein [Lysobacter enzymogenes]|uniref:4'-phosphopantetheinyl transferase family protein n=1 Tax=Lysobacter enzymogenes TaxID=69 RepID=UPI00099B95D6|nr:4'-phosphopantetheinyl transferase superfamily protein [Lysobacter enzymogenes]UZW58824.1 4'-phosphopantetheinyl transferase superfamily protein [Lysobacter enzymogenes]